MHQAALDTHAASEITIEHVEAVVALKDGRQYRFSASRQADNQVEQGLSTEQWFEGQAAMQPYSVSCWVTAFCRQNALLCTKRALTFLCPTTIACGRRARLAASKGAASPGSDGSQKEDGI